MRYVLLLFAGLLTEGQEALAGQPTVRVRGTIVDAETGEPLPARIHLQASDGNWFFPRSAASEGSAVEYRKERQPGSVEMHTTLSAHPFKVDLSPGEYTLTVERGKEYLPVERKVTVADQPLELRVELRRWINMAERGWYSGDTHVHRTLEELPNLLRAEDLNVALPLSWWVTQAQTPPAQGDRSTRGALKPEPIVVDQDRVIYPINTEYEIFTVDGKPHTLGAVFVLGHRKPLELGAPPVRPIAEEARRQGALLDLDKHCWPWSLMLVPVMEVDLFELANNHMWRTSFGFRQWGLDRVPESMSLETNTQGLTEWGWIDYGFQTYYALLNCGFRLRPSAGTASGVHPVPLGFGRVYVHLPEGFSYERWMEGLGAGRSFVTTGPMLRVEVAGQGPGAQIEGRPGAAVYRVTGIAESAIPLDRIEIVANGRVAQTLAPANEPTDSGGYRSAVDQAVTLDGSGWIAVRTLERRTDGRVRFAHTAPVHITVPGHPLRPRREEIEPLIELIEAELQRNTGVLSDEALDEYRQALRVYRRIARQAR